MTLDKYFCKNCGAPIATMTRKCCLARTLIMYCSKCQQENIFYTPGSQVSEAAIGIMRGAGLVKQ